MLPLLIAAALASAAAAPPAEEDEGEPGIAPTAPIVYGGPAYRAAWDRAQRYEGDGRLGAYRVQSFQPVMQRQFEDVYAACTVGMTPPTFTLVVSYAASGQVDGVFVDQRSAASQCMAERFANLSAPPPPVPDFAEEIRVVP
ncbi:MAG: hypothetical protein K1X35_05690 [Caulobacteraceae bacterium]|nr:hypothetical protein [Caulobacteraceae bacterium]